MRGGVEVPRSVTILRIIAAPDVPTGATQAQVYPAVAELQAFLTALTGRLIGADKIQMAARAGHGGSGRGGWGSLHPTPGRDAFVPGVDLEE